jgi:hypothetical protein
MNDVNKTKRLKLSKGDWVWIAFAILLFLGGGIAGLFFISCVWFFVFSVRKCIASIKLSAERKKMQGHEKQDSNTSFTTPALKEAENAQSYNASPIKSKKKVTKGPAYPTYTIPEVRSISRYEKRDLNSSSFQNCFSQDEQFEIDYLLNSSDNLFDGGYDITDEYFQDFFKKAKSDLYETVTIDSVQRYSVIKKGEKYYFATLSGCTCKKFENECFCEHVVINAINQKVIDPINGIRNDDFATREKLNFVNENIIGCHGNILKVQTGFVKQSKVPSYFVEKGFLEVSSDIGRLVDSLSKSKINELIPGLKGELKAIDPGIKMGTLKVPDLKELIIKNEHVFEKYFRGYVYVELKEDIEDKMFECEDLAKWIIYTNKNYR